MGQAKGVCQGKGGSTARGCKARVCKTRVCARQRGVQGKGVQGSVRVRLARDQRLGPVRPRECNAHRLCGDARIMHH